MPCDGAQVLSRSVLVPSRRQASERFELIIGDCLKCVLSLDTKTLQLSLRLPIRFGLIVAFHGLYGLLI